MTPKEYHVTFKQVEPEPMWIDFEGAHIRIFGALAFFYKAFKTTYSEDKAQYELRPWLLAVKEKKSGAISPEHAAPSL